MTFLRDVRSEADEHAPLRRSVLARARLGDFEHQPVCRRDPATGRGRLPDLNPEAGALLVYVVPCERVEFVDAHPRLLEDEQRQPPSVAERSCRLWMELSQAQLERLDAANGELGAHALLKAVALRLADEASAIQSERRRAAFADDRAVSPR